MVEATRDPFPIDLDFTDNIIGVHWDVGGGDYVLGAFMSAQYNRFHSEDGSHWTNVDDSYFKYHGNTYNSQHNEDGLGGGWVDNPYEGTITAATYDTKRRRYIFGGAGLHPNEPDEYPVHGDLVNWVRVDTSRDGVSWTPINTDMIQTPPFRLDNKPVGWPAWLFYDEPSDTTFMCVAVVTNVGIGPAQYYKSVNGGAFTRYGTDNTTLAPFVDPGVANFATGITDFQTGTLISNGKPVKVKVKSTRYYPLFNFGPSRYGPAQVAFGASGYVPMTPPQGNLAELVVGDGVIGAITWSDAGDVRAWSSDDAETWAPIAWPGIGGPQKLAWGSGGMVIAGNAGEYGEALQVMTSEDGHSGYSITLSEPGISVEDPPRGGVSAVICRPQLMASRKKRTTATRTTS